MLNNFDVAIFGGGPAGAATAISLLQKGCSVVLFERRRDEEIRHGETLVPAARRLLVDLGVWEPFLHAGHQKSHGILSAWGNAGLHENNFILNPYGNGWHLDRARFDAMLLAAARKAGGRVLKGTQSIKCLERADGRWKLHVQVKDKLHQFTVRFLVDATGRSSYVAGKMGAKRILSDHLVGVVAFFHTHQQSPLHNGYTLLESQAGGWWYSAGLPGGKTVLAFMCDADAYARALKASPGFWQEQLDSSRHTKAGIISSNIISRPKPLAACTSRIHPVAGAHWLAVGDAAMSFDPLSSQGIYRALASGISAAQSIHDRVIDKTSTFRSYSRFADDIFDQYMSLRRMYYLKEQRWPRSSFWKRRHAT